MWVFKTHPYTFKCSHYFLTNKNMEQLNSNCKERKKYLLWIRPIEICMDWVHIIPFLSKHPYLEG